MAAWKNIGRQNGTLKRNTILKPCVIIGTASTLFRNEPTFNIMVIVQANGEFVSSSIEIPDEFQEEERYSPFLHQEVERALCNRQLEIVLFPQPITYPIPIA